ncbi:MAG TPA: hypothetical protein VM364_00690 [Vicinamibacterales bacterium]|nr:hypothetical protein [Vicinamibacterales bacterium]
MPSLIPFTPRPPKPREPEQPALFESAEADCVTQHDFQPTQTVWPGETFERMTWTCTRCGEVRGRC